MVIKLKNIEQKITKIIYDYLNDNIGDFQSDNVSLEEIAEAASNDIWKEVTKDIFEENRYKERDILRIRDMNDELRNKLERIRAIAGAKRCDQ